ncbi:unnamed protein product [Blumeria hordei]|uniref:Uncharacterized protein n=1 Tax=Blumeria hordei TaxID=2867405 RepID=A0A383UQ76_BLUHO|nr:unnamed protein product [Blumeria hordei]
MSSFHRLHCLDVGFPGSNLGICFGSNHNTYILAAATQGDAVPDAFPNVCFGAGEY